MWGYRNNNSRGGIMNNNIWFDVEVKPEKAKEIYRAIEEMQGVVDVSEYLRG